MLANLVAGDSAYGAFGNKVEVEHDRLTIAVHGREGYTRARYAIDDPTAMRDFMVKLHAELAGP
jgi:hypothetical protein